MPVSATIQPPNSRLYELTNRKSAVIIEIVILARLRLAWSKAGRLPPRLTRPL